MSDEALVVSLITWIAALFWQVVDGRIYHNNKRGTEGGAECS